MSECKGDFAMPTPEQMKVWRSLERAIKKCQKADLGFYVVLDRLHVYNKVFVACINEQDQADTQNDIYAPDINLPSIYALGFCSWADDSHYFEMNDYAIEESGAAK